MPGLQPRPSEIARDSDRDRNLDPNLARSLNLPASSKTFSCLSRTFQNLLTRCASPGGESSACIARAWSRVSRVPVGAGAQVPSPCLVATAAQTHLCCQAPTCHTNDAWRPTRAGATADRQQKQRQRGAGISAVHQRGAAVQQHAGAGGALLCLLSVLVVCARVCAMTAERNRSPFV